MIPILLSTLILNIFSFFNLLGIDKGLVITQLTFFIISILAFFIFKKIGLQNIKKNINAIYWLFIILFLLLFIFGERIRGSTRWFDLYFFNFQPSEFFKISLILFFSKFFVTTDFDIEKKSYFFKSLFYIFIPFILVYFEPDFGNAISYIFIFFIMILFSSIPKKYLFYSILIGLLFLPISWNFMKDYQKQRIISFIKPEINQLTSGYNSSQAIITIGSGKFLGRGLGYGTQSKLNFLPESHTDFAFASLIEQFGFFGGFIILILYFILIYSLIQKTLFFYNNKTIDNHYYFYYLLGLTSYLIFQISINIGMNLGILPITGISLPFISYGGSSLVTLFIGISILPTDKV
jgi:rod shape determining protein RodA